MTPTPKPKHNPILIALANILLIGAPYFFMHLYRRFFIFYAILFAVLILHTLSFTLLLSLGDLGLSSAIIVGLFIFAVVDSYAQAKKINNTSGPRPKWKKAQAIIGLLTMIAFVVAYFASVNFIDLRAPTGPFGQSKLDWDKSAQERREKQEAIDAKHTALKDKRCESFREDPDLSYELQRNFTEYCYFQKAIESNNPLYCDDYDASFGFDEQCIGSFAFINDQPNLCSEMTVYTCFTTSIMAYYPCRFITLAETQQRCEDEFKDFHDSLEL